MQASGVCYEAFAKKGQVCKGHQTPEDPHVGQEMRFYSGVQNRGHGCMNGLWLHEDIYKSSYYSQWELLFLNRCEIQAVSYLET